MQSFREAEKRKLRTPPEPWSLKDKLVAFSALGSALLVFIGTPFLSMYMSHRNAIDRRLTHWKIEYGLSESEILRLREIEISFHSPSLFGASKPLTAKESALHNQHLADQMNDESAQKFIEDQQAAQRGH